MISEIFSMLSTLEQGDKGSGQKFSINLARNHIRSISAYSSNSIFYFTTIVSDQATPGEVGMVSRVLEKSYASFVVTCISLMPFHRIKADDKASIEDYLSQFHQNLGIDVDSKSNVLFGKILGFNDSLDEAVQLPVSENAKKRVNDEGDTVPEVCPKCGSKIGVFLKGEPVFLCTNEKCKKYYGTVPFNESVDAAMLKQTQDFLLECWEKSRRNCTNFIKIVSETVSLNDMYQVDPIDPVTRVMQEAFNRRMDELNTWGFLGEATADMFDLSDEELEALTDEEIINSVMSSQEDDDDIDEDELDDSVLDEAGTVKTAINSIMFALESVSENKIMSCSNLTRLNALESKLNKLKNKYAKYLTRYKKQYNENKKKGTNKKLAIRFNGASISNPKAFMQQYGGYIKIINKRLKLVEKRRAELRKRKGLPAKSGKMEETAMLTELSDTDLGTIDRLIEAAEKQLLAPDDEAFILSEDSAADWQRRYARASSERDEAEARVSQLEEEIEELKRWREELQSDAYVDHVEKEKLEKKIGHMESNLRNLKREAERAGRATHQAKRYEKLYNDTRKQVDDLNKQKENLEKKLASSKGTDAGKSDVKVGDVELNAKFDRRHHKSELNYAAAAAKGFSGHHTFDKEVFTNMDMKKANEAIPTFTRASIGFIVDETEQVVTRDVLVGIKVQIHRCTAKDMVDDIYNCIINKRKFLKFVKFISGEEKSLADLMFGFKELKLDAVNSVGAKRWNSAFRQRKRWAKMSIPYLFKNYTPNGTVVITMNEVQFLRDEYGIDIMRPDHVRMLMDAGFLLGFVVLDQANEMCYITYDGHNGEFQEYTYAMLEREQQTTDRMMRELYRSISR